MCPFLYLGWQFVKDFLLLFNKKKNCVEAQRGEKNTGAVYDKESPMWLANNNIKI